MIYSQNWEDHLVKMIVVEEYYIYVVSQEYGKMQFRVRYVKHNGYTVIESLPEYNRMLSSFEKWFHMRSDLNTRYDLPHWWQPIRFNRRKIITKWALKTIERAFKQYHQENVNAVIPE